MANQIFNSFKGQLIAGAINWEDGATTDIRVMLLDSNYSPDIDNEEWKSDIDLSGHEITGTGYTAGGALLIGRAIVRDDVNDWSEADATDLTWPSSTLTARGAVVYKDTGTPATSPVIAYIDFGTDKVSTDGNFTIIWNEDGVFRIG